MTDQAYLRRLERRLTAVRVLGLAGLVAASLFWTFPRSVVPITQLIVAPILLVGTLTIFFLNRSVHSERSRSLLGFVAAILDTTVVIAAVSLYGVHVALLFIPMEFGLRYRLRGAISGAFVSCAVLAILVAGAAQLDVEPIQPATAAIIGVLSLITAYLVGSAAQMWQQTQVALELHAKRLVELDRLRDRYVAITSHEIRGPLTAIITGIETIRNRGDRMDAEMRTHVLDMVSEQANQLARLVDDLMIGSELEAGELSIRPEMTELETIVQRGVEGASPRRRQHHLELFVEPLRCEVDPYRISQMLRNLIENAYKYTPDRTRVVVSGKAVEDGVELEVADDGPGIPPEERDKLFEAFSRLQETVAGKEGVGLGLYVVSQLATAMDGRIDLASSSRGTTFTIRIPCRTEPIDHPRMGLISNEEV